MSQSSERSRDLDLERICDLEDCKAYICHALGGSALPEPGPLLLTRAADRLMEKAVDWIYLVAQRGDFDSDDARRTMARTLHEQMHGYHFWPVTLPWPATTRAGAAVPRRSFLSSQHAPPPADLSLEAWSSWAGIPLRPCRHCGAWPQAEDWPAGGPNRVMLSCWSAGCEQSVVGESVRAAIARWNQLAAHEGDVL